MSHTTRAAVKTGRRRAGFSMIELVIVVVIIGIIAAIAIPRMSRGAAGAADSALAQNLAILRNALDLFATEHSGKYPAAADVVNALTMHTTSDYTSAVTLDPHKDKNTATGRIYGPYLRVIPPISVGSQKGNAGIAEAAGAGVAWIYNPADGTIKANASGMDTSGKKDYADY